MKDDDAVYVELSKEEVLAKLVAARALLLEIEDADIPWLAQGSDEIFALENVMDKCPDLLDIAIRKLG